MNTPDEKIITGISPIRVDEINDKILDKFGIRLLVKRLDLVHPFVSGNKYFKLKYNLQEARKLGHDTLLTFGGAYSNHILATAAAGKEAGLNTIGIIRGEEIRALNPVLQKAENLGMKFEFIERATYRKKEEPGFISDLTKKFGDFYLLPEGGSNLLAVMGCKEILDEKDQVSSSVFCSCGTGATLAGLILSLNNHQEALGISVLKGEDFLEKKIKELLAGSDQEKKGKWKMIHDYDFGGYARSTNELELFIEHFISKTGIPIEPIYTGKMFFAIYDMVQKGFFPKGETLLAIHTGGIN